MIENETQHRHALKQLEQNDEFIAAQRAAFEGAGFSPEEVERGLEPLASFRAGLQEEIEGYENAQRAEHQGLR